jgi:transcriptional regulator with XRE-family HTH domain
MIYLAGLRRMAGVTQVELADALGTSQGQISRLEKQRDMLLSTLGAYLRALGLDAKIVVEVGEQTVEYNLAGERRRR